MTRKFGGSAVLEIPTWCGRKLQTAASHHKLPPGSVSGPEISADSSHTTRPFSALFSTWLPLVSTFAGIGPTFPRIALETVTMVRYDLSMVVTDQKHDEQFFHEGSHV
jgi:hypothetical protein